MRFTCPRLRVAPIAGKHAATGTARTAHHDGDPGSRPQIDALGDVCSNACARTCTPAHKQHRLKAFQIASDARNGTASCRNSSGGGSAKGTSRIARRGGKL